MFTLDRASSTPLADQIEARLRALVDSGQLPAGARLTSIRALASQLGVSPNTVVTAYDRLVALGLVESHGTAGFFVNGAGASNGSDALIEAGEEHDAVWLVQRSHDLRVGTLPASSGALPVSWLEDAIPASVVQRGLARAGGGMATRCPPQGVPELRERLAMLMRGQGIAVDASRLLTTFGGTQAIDLTCRAFLRPGDAVLVDDPGYFLLFDRLRLANVCIVPVKRRHDGPDLEQFEAACVEHRPRLFFVQTVLHNPTGWSSSAANLHRLLSVAEKHQVLLFEDDVHGHFHPGATTRLAQLSELRGVVYSSSFCKALSPALRLGYVAAEPALLKVLMREKIHSVLTTPALNEFVLLELLASGRFRKHADRLQKKLHAARSTASRLLRDAGVLLDWPADGGMFLWGSAPAGVDVGALVKEAYQHNIVLAQGAAFSSDPALESHMRFNVVFSQQPRLAEFLKPRLNGTPQPVSRLQRVR